jgi:ABC-2 type transport system permease protein
LSESFAKAADEAVQEAQRRLRGITGADVVSMSADVEDGRISNFKAGRRRWRELAAALF